MGEHVLDLGVADERWHSFPRMRSRLPNRKASFPHRTAHLKQREEWSQRRQTPVAVTVPTSRYQQHSRFPRTADSGQMLRPSRSCPSHTLGAMTPDANPKGDPVTMTSDPGSGPRSSRVSARIAAECTCRSPRTFPPRLGLTLEAVFPTPCTCRRETAGG